MADNPQTGAPSEENKKAASDRKAPTKKVIFIVGAIAVLVVSAYLLRDAFFYVSTDDAQVAGHVMPLSARINGQVAEARVVQGQVVHAGDVLVVIDPQDYKVALDQAEAQLSEAQATASSSHWTVPVTSISVKSTLSSSETSVSNAEVAVQAAEKNLDSAKALLQQAEANAAKSDADLTRYEQLVAKEDISRQQYDQGVAAAKSNRAAVISAQAVVEASDQTVLQQKGKLSQAQSDLQSAKTAPQQILLTRARAESADAVIREKQAQLTQAKLNLGYTVIRSPVSGIIGQKSVEVGQNVNIGQELLEVVPLDDIWITANFKETQLAHMSPGQPVQVRVDAYGRSWSGRVTNLGGGTGSVFSLLPPENATGNYVKVVQRVPIRIDFDRGANQEFNSDGLLKPGLSVEPKVRVR